MKSLADILVWLSGPDGGAFIVVSWAIAWGLEGTAWWEAITSRSRSLIILAISAVLGVLSVLLSQNPALVEAIEPYFRGLMGVIVAWLATQAAHKLDPKAKEDYR